MVSPAEVPVIETGRLTLRPLRASDAGPMTLYASDPRVARMTTSIPHPYPPGAAEAYIAGQARRVGERVWAIDASRIGAGELVGLIVHRAHDAAEGEIGYWVGPPFWNTGYASEALAAVVARVLADGTESLVARVFADNPASAHVLGKAGFVPDGEVHAHSVARGETVAARLWRLDRAGAMKAGVLAGESER
jgi:RimJ/RimL family protein N-acetyltransferase